MKEIKITTSKGEFLVVDYDNKELFSKFLLNVFKKYNIQNNHKRYKLSKITEEQSSEIVESHKNCKRYYYEKSVPQTYYDSALNCLHSLLKSKGIHLYENPIAKPLKTQDVILCNYDWELEQWQEAEAKTFYNPYIFKL